MSNTNLFRKGLATSAIAALGVSVLTGVAPASAVDPAVSLELSHGTSTNVKTWDFAELKAGFSLAANPFAQAGYYTGDSGDTWITADANYSVMPISYLIESLDGATVYGSTYDGYDHHGYDGGSTEDYYGGNWDDLTDTYYKDANSTDTTMVIEGGRYHNVTNRLWLDLESAPSDKASRVKVTAFLDHNNDNEITVGTDESAAPITINFNRPADLSAVTELTQPIVGDDYLNATTTVSPTLNDDFTYGANSRQWGESFLDMGIDFTVENYPYYDDQNGHNFESLDFETYSDGVYTSENDSIYDGYNNNWYVIPGNYEAQLYVYGTAVGNISRKVVAARHFNDAVFSAVEGDDMNYEAQTIDYTADYFSGYYTADYAEVRAGAGAQTFTVTSYDDEGDLNPAGTKLNLLVDHTYNWTGDYELKVNGNVVEEGDKVELTVGADGKVTFTVQNTGDDWNSIWDEAGFLVESAEGNWRGSDALYVQWEPEYYRIFDQNGDYDDDAVRNINSGASYTFNLAVVDQWGVAPANNTYRVVANYSGRIDQDTTATAVVNGRAAVTVTDDANTEPQSRDGFVGFYLEKLVNFGTDLYPNNQWVDVDDESDENYEDAWSPEYRTTYYVQAAGRIDGLTAGDVTAAEGAWYANHDNRLGRANYHDALWLDDLGDWDNLTGYVRNAVTDVYRVGAPVTITANDVQFSAGYYAWNKLTQNSITVYANNNGWFGVSFAAHKKGDLTFTVTSGGVSKTVTVYVDNLAAANVAVSQVAASQAGKSVVTTATVTDKWGNSVDEGAVAFKSTMGHYDATSVNLDDNGVATSTLFVESNDLGTATVTATAGDAVGTATTTFGITDGHVFKNKKRVTATWEFAKGKTVAIYRDGRRVRNIPVATDDAGKFSFNVKKGKHNVTLKIAGVVVYSYTFNVK